MNHIVWLGVKCESAEMTTYNVQNTSIRKVKIRVSASLGLELKLQLRLGLVYCCHFHSFTFYTFPTYFDFES